MWEARQSTGHGFTYQVVQISFMLFGYEVMYSFSWGNSILALNFMDMELKTCVEAA